MTEEVEELRGLDTGKTKHDPDFQIGIQKEQERLLAADTIVLAIPFGTLDGGNLPIWFLTWCRQFSA
ncbi:hypothetical protein [Streptococcus loxodontisalivarius]|uniref:NADPH-quinone reductase n=1 Tax=Streptococcus loxodontisalivarius TaxID=1349415 RepID=A0ABS2PSM6_9STRE|nr:putative NADPH-quinone reductase [Streptococcus loxodontisalivarius]